MTDEDASADVLRRTKAALALASGSTTDEAGEKAGVTGRTVRRWRDDPAFTADVRKFRQQLLDEVLSYLSGAAIEAAKTLRGALTEDSPAIRVRAAMALLTTLVSVRTTVDLEERLAALEATYEERQLPG